MCVVVVGSDMIGGRAVSFFFGGGEEEGVSCEQFGRECAGGGGR